MVIISTRTDIVTYLADVCPDLCGLGDRYVSAVCDQIQHSDHPAWGEDWTAWLGAELDALITETVHGIDAIETVSTYYDRDGDTYQAAAAQAAADQAYGTGNHDGVSMWSYDDGWWTEHVLGSGAADLVSRNRPPWCKGTDAGCSCGAAGCRDGSCVRVADFDEVDNDDIHEAELVARWDAINNPHGVAEFPAQLVDCAGVTYVVTTGTGDGNFAYDTTEFEAGIDAMEASCAACQDLDEDDLDRAVRPYDAFCQAAEASTSEDVARAVWDGVEVQIDSPGSCQPVVDFFSDEDDEDDEDEDDEDEAAAIAAQLDLDGAWDWTEDTDTDPCDRYAVVDRGGVWMLVYAGSEPAVVWVHDSRDSAVAHLQDAIDEYPNAI